MITNPPKRQTGANPIGRQTEGVNQNVFTVYLIPLSKDQRETNS